MALTYSSMLPLGTKLIDFNLPNTISNQNFDSSDLMADKPILLMIICNHCPYVIHYHDELKRLHKDYSESLSFVAISSNDVANYPEDRPEKMKELWAELNFTFPLSGNVLRLLNLAARFTASPPLEWPINIILLKSTLLYSGERESLLNSFR